MRIDRAAVAKTIVVISAAGIGAAAGAALCSWPAGRQFWNTRDWVATADAAANVAQIVAFAIAGWWTYWLFVRHRQSRERASLTHKVIELAIQDAHRLMRVEVTVQNIGNVILKPPAGSTKVYQAVPLDSVVAVATPAHIAATDPGTPAKRSHPVKCELPWRRIARADYALGDEMILEPGEIDSLSCDFCIPAEVEAVFVRSEVTCGYVENPSQHWHVETFHRLTRSS